MKLKMDLYLNGLTKIKRTIQVNDNLSLQKFCQYVIYSMNGNCKHLYQLTLNESHSYLCPTCFIIDYDNEEMMEDKTLEDIGLYTEDELMVNYDFKCDWEFILEITDMEEGYYDKEFEVISGEYCGILEDCGGVTTLKKLISKDLDVADKRFYEKMIKGYKEYDINNFNFIDMNNKIFNEFNQYREQIKPKHYILNISLEGYNKEIKRKMSVDSNISLDEFCRCVIVSMQGDLSHSYTIKINKQYLEEYEINNYDMNYLQLKEKQKFKVIYDFGDNWIFNITVSKIEDGYGYPKRIEVLSGKGYGIVEDCGGLWEIGNIFKGTSNYCKQQDINEFNLERINKKIDFEI